MAQSINYEPAVNHAEKLLALGRLAEAVELATKVFERDPRHGVALSIVGRVLLNAGQIEAGLLRLRQAELLDQRTARLPMNRGLALLKLGRPAAAAAAFVEAIRRRPGMIEAREALRDVREGLPVERAATVAVIIPTTGNPRLLKAVDSVLAQSWEALSLHVVMDGPEAAERARPLLGARLEHPSLQVLELPRNVGAGGWNGHRVYASVPFLVDAEFLCFLDEDNWFAPEHVESLMTRVLTQGWDWAWALRRLVDDAGELLLLDDCESLGSWSAWNGDSIHLVDVSCYLLRRDIAMDAAGLWMRRFRDDRFSPDFWLCKHLLQAHPRCGTSGQYSVNYRVGGSAQSSNEAFFRSGNAAMVERYPDGFPWRAAASS